MPALSTTLIDAFQRSFGGDVITPTDKRYESARRVWNGMIDKRPAAVVRPTNSADVAAAVKLGRDNDLEIAVRCGGHSLPGLSTVDDGIVIDLSAMRGVTVDAAKATARANGGALLAELDAAAQAVGMVCPVGVVGHTGVGGLTLGGGMGRLQRRFGLTIDNLLSVELVTADGRNVRASADENPELFWGMRGAGANFGIVTAFEYWLHPLQARVTRGARIYPAHDIARIWSAFREYALVAPDEVHLAINIGYATDPDDLPEPISGGPVVTIGYVHSGDPARVEADIAPLQAAGVPALESQALESYVALQGSADEIQGWGHRYYNKGGFVDDLPADVLERIVEHVSDGAGSGSWGGWTQGGAMARVPEDAMAFTGRSAQFDISAECQWDQAAQDDERSEWVRKALAITQPYQATGRYVNEASDTGDQVVRQIYGDAKMARLVDLKRRWDPDNVFHLNQNIKP